MPTSISTKLLGPVGLWFALLALFAVFALGACGSASPSDDTAARPVAQTVSTTPPATLVLGGCIDATGSVGKDFGASMRERVADLVGSRIPAKPADSSRGVAGIAGLSLELRLVATWPLGEQAPYVRVEVPAVSGLAPMPNISDKSALDASTPGAKSPYEAWRDQKSAWDSAYALALAGQKDAARKIRSLSLDGGMSGITSCMSSLAQDLRSQDLRSASKPRYLLASDLQENVSPQLSGSLDNQLVFVVQPCPSGVAQTCDRDFKHMSGQLKQLHAGRIVRETQASADQAVSAWMKTDS